MYVLFGQGHKSYWGCEVGSGVYFKIVALQCELKFCYKFWKNKTKEADGWEIDNTFKYILKFTIM